MKRFWRLFAGWQVKVRDGLTLGDSVEKAFATRATGTSIGAALERILIKEA